MGGGGKKIWSLLHFGSLPTQALALTACGDEQADLFDSAGLHGNLQFICTPEQKEEEKERKLTGT